MDYEIIDNEDPRLAAHRRAFKRLYGRPLRWGDDLPVELPNRLDLEALRAACPALRLPEDMDQKLSALICSGYIIGASKSMKRPVFVDRPGPEEPLAIRDFVLVLVSDPVEQACDVCDGTGHRMRDRVLGRLCDHCLGQVRLRRFLSAYLTRDSDDWLWLTLVGHSNAMEDRHPDYSGHQSTGSVHARCDQVAGLKEALRSPEISGFLAMHTEP